MSQGFTNIGEYQKGKSKSRLGSHQKDDSAIRKFFDKKPGSSLEDTARSKLNRYLDASNIQPQLKTTYKEWLLNSKDLHTMNMNVLSKVFELYAVSNGEASSETFAFDNLIQYVQHFVPENVISTYESTNESKRVVLFAMIDCIRYFYYIQSLQYIHAKLEAQNKLINTEVEDILF